jgi:hypothetical protein
VKAKKADPKPAGELPAIAACPSCGRRPSERVALCWRPEYEGPTTTACNDQMHHLADTGPELHSLAVILMRAMESLQLEDPARKAMADFQIGCRKLGGTT